MSASNVLGALTISDMHAVLVAVSQVIDVFCQVLTLVGVKVEAPQAQESLLALGARFICLSCDAAIVMDFQCLVCHNLFSSMVCSSLTKAQSFHCRRHEAMQVALPSEDEAQLKLHYPFSPGSYTKLSAKTLDVVELRSKKIFGCRHCLKAATSGAAVISSNGAMPSTTQASGPLMSFDGLVSHLKAKWVISDIDFSASPPFDHANYTHRHGIPHGGDEDFFQNALSLNVKEAKGAAQSSLQATST